VLTWLHRSLAKNLLQLPVVQIQFASSPNVTGAQILRFSPKGKDDFASAGEEEFFECRDRQRTRERVARDRGPVQGL
jgi:hypothetical protein